MKSAVNRNQQLIFHTLFYQANYLHDTVALTPSILLTVELHIFPYNTIQYSTVFLHYIFSV